jgi:cysteine synthase A
VFKRFELNYELYGQFLNPGGSAKDRVALNIIKTAEEEGILHPDNGSTVFEGTVGSTGISIAMIARAKGYNAWIVMPDDQAKEKYQLLEKLGATVEKVRPVSIIDKRQFVNLARTRAEEFSNDEINSTGSRGYFADQFENKANFQIHYQTTGPEIYRQTGGKIDAIVLGAGTGGTLSGITTYLKSLVPHLKVFLVDPPGSGLYHKVKHGIMYSPTEAEGTRRRHQVDTVVEGIGINRVTQNFDIGREHIDDAFRATDEEAVKMARFLVKKDGESLKVSIGAFHGKYITCSCYPCFTLQVCLLGAAQRSIVWGLYVWLVNLDLAMSSSHC